jgi:hypothetical protein
MKNIRYEMFDLGFDENVFVDPQIFELNAEIFNLKSLIILC